MKKKLDFDRCIKERKLEKARFNDHDTVLELSKLINHRESFWHEVKNKAEKYPSIFIEGHYEIVKELLAAIITLDGWKYNNHECLIIYMQQKYEQIIQIDFDFLQKLKDARNSIEYRGVMFGKERWNENKLKIEVTINTLKNYLNIRLGE